MFRVLAVVAVVALSSCGPGEGNQRGDKALMNPGENCLTCHVASGGSEASAYSVAGTLFGDPGATADAGVSGVSVIITDANGVDTTLTTNAAGNFYTQATLALPLKKAAVVRNGKTTAMSAAPASGACSSCHNQPPANNAPGRLYALP